MSMTLLIILTGVSALGYPFSETTFGGNYNLRYLSSNVRRILRPPMSIPSTFRIPTPSVDLGKHSLVVGVPISIYVPMAGFLWTDHLIWDMTLGGWDQNMSVRSVNHQRRQKSSMASLLSSTRQSAFDDVWESEWIGIYSSDNNRVVFRDVIGTVGTSPN